MNPIPLKGGQGCYFHGDHLGKESTTFLTASVQHNKQCRIFKEEDLKN